MANRRFSKAGAVAMEAAAVVFALGCAAQTKQAVVATPSDDEIAIEVVQPKAVAALGDGELPLLVSVSNLQRDMGIVFDRVAPQHPMAMMARMGLRAALGSAVGPELAGAVDLSAPMVGALVQSGDDSAALVAGHILDGSGARLREALGTEPMADDFVKLVGAVGGEADMQLSRDFFCALGPEPKVVIVCSDDDAALLASGGALLAALSQVRDDVALQVRYDQDRVAQAAENSEELDGSLSDLSPLLEHVKFNGELDYGVAELRIVPDGFELSFANLGRLGDDLVSRIVMAEPAGGEALPPMFDGPADTLSVLTFRGVDLAPFREELGELHTVLEGLVDDEQARKNLELMRTLPWPGGPFILAHGHDLAAAREAIDKELARKKPQQKRIDAASAGYLLFGVRAPLSDITAIVRGFETMQAQPSADGSPKKATLKVSAKPSRALKLPKGSLLLEMTFASDDAEAGEAPGAPEVWQGAVAGAGEWTWLALSRDQALAAKRAGMMVAGKGELPEDGRTALRPIGVAQASMLGYLTLASGLSLALAGDLKEDPQAALTGLQQALSEPEFSRKPIPVRVVVETAEDKRFRAEAHVKLDTALVAAAVRHFAQ